MMRTWVELLHVVLVLAVHVDVSAVQHRRLDAVAKVGELAVHAIEQVLHLLRKPVALAQLLQSAHEPHLLLPEDLRQEHGLESCLAPERRLERERARDFAQVHRDLLLRPLVRRTALQKAPHRRRRLRRHARDARRAHGRKLRKVAAEHELDAPKGLILPLANDAHRHVEPVEEARGHHAHLVEHDRAELRPPLLRHNPEHLVVVLQHSRHARAAQTVDRLPTDVHRGDARRRTHRDAFVAVLAPQRRHGKAERH